MTTNVPTVDWIIHKLDRIGTLLAENSKESVLEAAAIVLELEGRKIPLTKWFKLIVKSATPLVIAQMRTRMEGTFGYVSDPQRQHLMHINLEALRALSLEHSGGEDITVVQAAILTAHDSLNYRLNQTDEVWIQEYKDGSLSMHRSFEDAQKFAEAQNLAILDPLALTPVKSTAHTNRMIGWSTGVIVSIDMLENSNLEKLGK